MKTQAATREYHLNQAHALAQEAEQLEAYAEARRHTRSLKQHHPCYHLRPSRSFAGAWAALRAAYLRDAIQEHLIIVTDLSDYSEPSDHANESWINHLSDLADQAKMQALSDRQINSRLDASHHAKVA